MNYDDWTIYILLFAIVLFLHFINHKFDETLTQQREIVVQLRGVNQKLHILTVDKRAVNGLKVVGP